MYREWMLKQNSIVAWRKDRSHYIHHCPLKDFFFISKQIFTILEKEERVSKNDIALLLSGKILPNGSKFQKKNQSYKIDIIFSVLLIEGFVKKNGVKKSKSARGRYPHAFIMNKKRNEFIDWLRNVKMNENNYK